jgi:hypothetical protein
MGSLCGKVPISSLCAGGVSGLVGAVVGSLGGLLGASFGGPIGCLPGLPSMRVAGKVRGVCAQAIEKTPRLSGSDAASSARDHASDEVNRGREYGTHVTMKAVG